MSSEKRASPRASKAPSVFEPGDGPASTWSVSPTASSPDTAPAANTQRLAGGSEHVGKRIEVWWEGDKQWFGAVVQSYDSATRKHHILYDDNEEEDLDVRRTRCRLAKPKKASPSGSGKKEGGGGSAAKSAFRKNCPVCDRLFTHAPALATHMKSCGKVRANVPKHRRRHSPADSARTPAAVGEHEVEPVQGGRADRDALRRRRVVPRRRRARRPLRRILPRHPL